MNGALPVMLKPIVQGAGQPLVFAASMSAWRSEPAPASFVFVTVSVAPMTCTPVGIELLAAFESVSAAVALPVT